MLIFFNTKKLILLLLLVVVVLGMFVIVRIELANIERNVEPVLQFWIDAVNKSRAENLPSEAFIERYGERGQLVDHELLGQTLIQDIVVDSKLCAKYRIQIIYRVSPAEGSNLTMVRREGVDGLCVF